MSGAWVEHGGAWSPVQNSLALSTWQDPWASKGKGKETSKGIRAALAIELSLILLLVLASHGTEAIHVTIYSKNPQDVGRSKLYNRQKGPQSSKTSWDWCKLLQKLVRSHRASGKILVKGTPQKGLGKGWACVQTSPTQRRGMLNACGTENLTIGSLGSHMLLFLGYIYIHIYKV